MWADLFDEFWGAIMDGPADVARRCRPASVWNPAFTRVTFVAGDAGPSGAIPVEAPVHRAALGY